MSSCDNPDYELPELFTSNLVTAQKEHKCYECGAKISKGDLYQNERGLWLKFEEYKMCEKCADLRDSLNAADYCSAYGQLHEVYQEYLYDNELKPRERI